MKIQFQRAIRINKSATDIYRIISDLSKWNLWSPWFHCEPTASTQHHGNAGHEGQSQTWDGKVMGSGKLTIAQLTEDQLIRMVLEFYKPWKGLSEAVFTLTKVNNQTTDVHWHLDTSLPFFMFFFRQMMIAFMSNDFDRGLAMLKDYAETGSIPSKSVYLGVKDYDGFIVVGKKTTCDLIDLGQHIRKDCESLSLFLKDGSLPPPKQLVTLSLEHSIPKGRCVFMAGYVYPEQIEIVAPKGYEILRIPRHQGLSVDHTGSYRHLKNPWSMAVNHQRSLKIKPFKSIPNYELYMNSPGHTKESELKTLIVLPVKP